jgi:hypothetical protein
MALQQQRDQMAQTGAHDWQAALERQQALNEMLRQQRLETLSNQMAMAPRFNTGYNPYYQSYQLPAQNALQNQQLYGV